MVGAVESAISRSLMDELSECNGSRLQLSVLATSYVEGFKAALDLLIVLLVGIHSTVEIWTRNCVGLTEYWGAPARLQG